MPGTGLARGGIKCYAMSGTDVECGGICRRACYAMCGTDASCSNTSMQLALCAAGDGQSVQCSQLNLQLTRRSAVPDAGARARGPARHRRQHHP
eukprot:2999256-Rhodomonas_salina.2